MIGILLLAFGVATLNQYIERDTDRLMDRTASGHPTLKVTPNEALVFGILQCAVSRDISLRIGKSADRGSRADGHRRLRPALHAA